jgi:hypothetical protein
MWHHLSTAAGGMQKRFGAVFVKPEARNPKRIERRGRLYFRISGLGFHSDFWFLVSGFHTDKYLSISLDYR